MDVSRLVHQLSDPYTLLCVLVVMVAFSVTVWGLYRSSDTTDSSPSDE